MTVKLLTEHHLEFLRLKGGCTGLSESTTVKIPHCWKSQNSALSSFHFTLDSHVNYLLLSYKSAVYYHCHAVLTELPGAVFVNRL